MAHSKHASPNADNRRSHCPVSCALDIFGDSWTLLVIRDLMLGHSRFKDFTASPEGIPTNILSDRLERLTNAGIITRVPVSEGAKRYAYQLTEKGNALQPVLLAMKNWGLQWEDGTKVSLEAISGLCFEKSRTANIIENRLK